MDAPPLRAVFLSYASQDAEVARQVCEALRAEGIEVWFDESQLTGGEAWDASIRRQIRDCALFMPIISAHTQERREGYFRLEWKIADERSQLIAEGTPFLLPVVADGIKERDALVPKSFLTVQWTWLPHGAVPPAFVLRVKKVLGAGGRGANAAAPAGMEAPTMAGGIERQRLWSWLRLLPWAAAVLFGSLFWWKSASPGPWRRDASGSARPPPVTHAIVQLPPEAPLASARVYPLGISYPSLALSPDGTTLAYVALVGTTTQLYLRPMDHAVARPIPETEGAYLPFFSPDSRWLGFFVDDKLKKVSVQGGAAITLCVSPSMHVGACWGDDRRIYFAPHPKLARISDTGGPIEFLQEDKRDVLARYPAMLPGAKSMIGSFYTGVRSSLSADFSPISILPLSTMRKTTVVDRGYHPQFVSSGHLIFARGRGLLAVAFDPDQTKPSGESVAMIDGVMLHASDHAAQFAVSASGTLVYAAGPALDKTKPAWVDREGRHTFLPMPTDTYGELELSPDGSRLAILLPGVKEDLWVFDVHSGNGAPLLEPGANGSPKWTPDGKKLIFHSVRDGRTNVYWKTMDGSSPKAELLLAATGPDSPVSPHSCSPDGSKLIILMGTGNGDAYALALDGSRRLEPAILDQRAYHLRFSPDGRWLSYTSNKSGKAQIYVQSYPAGKDAQQISFEGGDEEIWSEKGDELFYRNGDSWISVPITLQPAFKITGPPRVLVKRAFANVFGYSVGVAPDARRFLMLLPAHEEKPVTELHVISNWSEELKRRVPAGGAATAKPR